MEFYNTQSQSDWITTQLSTISQPRILNVSLCPTLPLYPTIPIGGVCIPVNFINHSNFANFQYNADSEFTLSLYQIIICGLMGSGRFIVFIVVVVFLIT
uniref:Uncharacterized protein n=1 Tax=Schistosoma haematobium TaxID=6185 RepID=A0A095AJZ6_SCHHA